MTNGKETPEAAAVREALDKKRTEERAHPPKAMDHLALALMVGIGAELPEALEGLAHLRRDFVDWNEIRVARVQELSKSIGEYPWAEAAAGVLKEEYNAFFDKKGALGFDFLATGKPAESRRALVQFLPCLAKGAQSILLFEFCPGATLPLSDEGLRSARKDGIGGKNIDKNQLTRILTESLPLAEAAELVQYWELEATGSPYSEPLKKDAHLAKKAKKGLMKVKPGK